jgi:hypothetical protein
MTLMGDERRYLEPASTQYDEWVGTSAFDDAANDENNLYRVLGLPEGYWIVGFSLGLMGPRGGWGVWFYVVEDSRVPDWKALEQLRQEEGGEIPVIEIEAPHLDWEKFAKAFKRISLTAMRKPSSFQGGSQPPLRIERSVHLDDL